MATLLAGDIGGTKTILRLVAAEPAAVSRACAAQETLAEERYASADFPDLAPMVRRFLRAVAQKSGSRSSPQGACFGIAGPVIDNTCELTNLAWSLDGARLAHELGIGEVKLINDFAAIGYGVLVLRDDDLQTLQEGAGDPEAPIAVIGAGTGLGEGFMVPHRSGFRAFATEGGHVDFAPRTVLEFHLLSYLQESHQLTHVSVERVVSGRGIPRIYEFLRNRSAADESPKLAEAYRTWKQETGRERKTVDLAAEISRAAIAGGDDLARQTMRIFLEAYGAEAGNLALKLLPFGGLYVAGGIAGKNLPLIEEGQFLEALLAKGRMRPVLERLPVHVVRNRKVGLLGAALRAAQLLA